MSQCERRAQAFLRLEEEVLISADRLSQQVALLVRVLFASLAKTRLGYPFAERGWLIETAALDGPSAGTMTGIRRNAPDPLSLGEDARRRCLSGALLKSMAQAPAPRLLRRTRFASRASPQL